MASLIVSKERVTDYGEVLTAPREVNAMLDLVKQETERVESRFLEPACGDGNFLAEILDRKLRGVGSRYGRSRLDYERNAVLAVCSIYGIDILEDNVSACRSRLFGIFDRHYSANFKSSAREECRDAIRYILERNIIHGDALSLKSVGPVQQPIIFSEWTAPFNNSLLKRRDYTFFRAVAGWGWEAAQPLHAGAVFRPRAAGFHPQGADQFPAHSLPQGAPA